MNKINKVKYKAEKVCIELEKLKPGLYKEVVKNAVIRMFEDAKKEYPYPDVIEICDQSIEAVRKI